MLRPGNVHSAEGWRPALQPVIAHDRERGLLLYFRGGSACVPGFSGSPGWHPHPDTRFD
jgi:hypothetical protein